MCFVQVLKMDYYFPPPPPPLLLLRLLRFDSRLACRLVLSQRCAAWLQLALVEHEKVHDANKRLYLVSFWWKLFYWNLPGRRAQLNELFRWIKMANHLPICWVARCISQNMLRLWNKIINPIYLFSSFSAFRNWERERKNRKQGVGWRWQCTHRKRENHRAQLPALRWQNNNNLHLVSAGSIIEYMRSSLLHRWLMYSFLLYPSRLQFIYMKAIFQFRSTKQWMQRRRAAAAATATATVSSPYFHLNDSTILKYLFFSFPFGRSVSGHVSNGVRCFRRVQRIFGVGWLLACVGCNTISSDDSSKAESIRNCEYKCGLKMLKFFSLFVCLALATLSAFCLLWTLCIIFQSNVCPTVCSRRSESIRFPQHFRHFVEWVWWIGCDASMHCIQFKLELSVRSIRSQMILFVLFARYHRR